MTTLDVQPHVESEVCNDLQSLKMALAQKFRNVRRFKNNKIGVSRNINLRIPFSVQAFRSNFKMNVQKLSDWSGESQFVKLSIKELEPVLGSRWNIGQSKLCSTQARIIGDVSLRYRRTKVDVKQTSFLG